MTDTKLTDDNIILSSLVLDNIEPLERKDFIGIYKSIPEFPCSKGFIFIAYEVGDTNGVVSYYENNKYFYNYIIGENRDKSILYIVLKYDDIEFLETKKRYGLLLNCDFDYFYRIICLWHNYLRKPQLEKLVYKNFHITL